MRPLSPTEQAFCTHWIGFACGIARAFCTPGRDSQIIRSAAFHGLMLASQSTEAPNMRPPLLRFLIVQSICRKLKEQTPVFGPSKQAMHQRIKRGKSVPPVIAQAGICPSESIDPTLEYPEDSASLSELRLLVNSALSTLDPFTQDIVRRHASGEPITTIAPSRSKWDTTDRRIRQAHSNLRILLRNHNPSLQ